MFQEKNHKNKTQREKGLKGNMNSPLWKKIRQLDGYLLTGAAKGEQGAGLDKIFKETN